MVRKEILIGLSLGLLTNIVGTFFCILIISKVKNFRFVSTFNSYLNNEVLWMPLALGALPNLLVFFWFLRKNKEFRARGVLFATFISAIIAYLIYFL